MEIRNRISHPNIVVVLADDMGYGDPGAYNSSSQIPTPNPDSSMQEVTGELYNLNDDRLEQNNLFEERPDKVRELKKLFQDIRN